MSHYYYTNLVGVKWTKSSLIKALERNYTTVFREIIQSNKLSKKQKNKKIDNCLKVFLSIYTPVMDYGVTVKKQDGDNYNLQTQTNKQNC